MRHLISGDLFLRRVMPIHIDTNQPTTRVVGRQKNNSVSRNFDPLRTSSGFRSSNWSRVPLSGRYESAGEVLAPEKLVRTFGGPRTVQPRLRLPGRQIATSWSLWAEE